MISLNDHHCAHYNVLTQTKQLEEISFEPIVPTTVRLKRHKEKNILDLAFAKRVELYFPPPDIEICK